MYENSYNEAVAYLEEIPMFTKKHDLNHTRDFLAALGHPEAGRKIIHVAGTNGKGSVCAYTQAVLLAEGKRVGFFCSPHLVRHNERIRIQGQPVSDEQFVEGFWRVRACVEKESHNGFSHPTYFEYLFGMAMLLFAQADVEYMIIETGLGGRLDLTNVLEQPILTMITSIGLDHAEILGHTIGEIAAEKAGIIKPKVPVVFDGNDAKAAKVISRQAAQQGAPCREITKNAYEIKKITDKYIAFSCSSAYDESITWKIKSTGVYQVMNATLALAGLECIAGQAGLGMKREKWQEAIAGVCWEGRMEEVEPGVIFDGAHNQAAVLAAAESIRQQPRTGRLVVLFGAVADKDYEAMIECLCTQVMADLYVVTGVSDVRGEKASKLTRLFGRYTKAPVFTIEEPREAYQYAKEARGADGVLYCLGSLYLIGELKQFL